MFSNYDEALDFINLPCKIREELYFTSSHHVETKYHKESLLDHLFKCGQTCITLSSHFNIPSTIAFWVGFLHDIGKSLARHQIKHRVIFTGHAQLGSRILELINTNHMFPLAYKEIIMWVIDNHMCCCCKEKSNHLNIKDYKNLLLLSIPKEQNELAIRMLCMLTVADDLSRISDEVRNEEELITFADYLCNELENNVDVSRNVCKLKQISNERIIIHPLGLSGSGKSSFCLNLISRFSNQKKICHIERDTCYLEIALKHGYHIKANNVIDYKDYYNFVSSLENGKEQVQQLWITKLNDALEDTSFQIILIDSVQTLYNTAWQKTISSLNEEAKSNYLSSLKVATYLIPLHLFEIPFESKIGEYTKYPNDTVFFPPLNLENGTLLQSDFDIGSGSISLTYNIINTFLQESILPKIEKQVTFIDLIKQKGNLELAIHSFPKGIIETHIEHKDDNFIVTTISYKDGLQIFIGESRDYRGETIVQDLRTNQYHLLRGSLPVFPDYCSIEKDPAVFPYIYDIFKECMPNRKEWFSKIDKQDAKYAVTMKYDGSLFNLTFIPYESSIYPIIEYLIKIRKDWYIKKIKEGILIVGSKGRITVVQTNAVRSRIENSMIGSYDSIENFYQEVQLFIQNNQIHSNCTFHFEAIDAIPTSELTVYYGKAWCPFLGYTLFDENGKKFLLPPLDHNFKVSTPVIWFNDMKSILNFFNQNYEKLLNGDQEIEPEGYVVHIFPNESTKWYPLKMKYQFYYVAHKPNSKKNSDMAKELLEEDKYSLLRSRLAKFREKPKMEDIIKDTVVEFIKEWKKELMQEGDLKERKYWAFFVKRKENMIRQWTILFEDKIKHHYSHKHINLYKIVMDSYNKDQDFILECLLKQLK